MLLDSRKDVKLRRLYEEGEISSDEFIKKLFESEECDRVRRNIVNRNKRRHSVFSKGGYTL